MTLALYLVLAGACLAFVVGSELVAHKAVPESETGVAVLVLRGVTLFLYTDAVMVAGLLFRDTGPAGMTPAADAWQVRFAMWGLALFAAWFLNPTLQSTVVAALVPLGWLTYLVLAADPLHFSGGLNPPSWLAHSEYATEPVTIVPMLATGLIAIALTLLRGVGAWFALLLLPAGLFAGFVTWGLLSLPWS